MRYLVTEELKTSFLLKVKRFFRLAKPRMEFFANSYATGFYPEDKSYYMCRNTVKIIKRAKQRLVWKQ